MEQLQPDSSSQAAVITPLYIPCLRPLQLVCGDSSSKRRLLPLASPHKRVSGKKGMRCCRQLFNAADSPARTAALEFWLQTMEKVSRRPSHPIPTGPWAQSGLPACLWVARMQLLPAQPPTVFDVCCLYVCRLWRSRTLQSRRSPWPEAGASACHQQLRLMANTAAAAPPCGVKVLQQVGRASWRV
jgi:hypothetical protein